MKKYILMPVLALCAVNMAAQEFDAKPSVTIENEKENMHFTVGARFMADAAYYNTEYTPMKSGAAITDARIRTSFKFDKWQFYADFGFGGGKFSQKNIFLQYTQPTENGATHSIKGGYYTDPAGAMSRNTSLGSYHFISRAGAADALEEGRELGISYKFNSNRFMAYQGIFTENQYNKQAAGFNGVVLAGRYIYRPIADQDQTLAIGANIRFQHVGGGIVEANTLKKTIDLGQSLETFVDGNNKFVSCSLPWAENVIDAGAEAIYHNNKFFARGEYLYKHVTKKRDSKTLFDPTNNNIDTWGTLEAWITANPLRNNSFHGAYVELGYLIFGNSYKYDSENGTLKGLSGRSLEIVARYNYTGLNDILSGEYFSLGRKQYYPSGQLQDWPYKSTSVGGGNINSITLGLNYSFNKYTQLMLDYTYHNLKNDYMPYDKNLHAVQARMQFAF